MRRVEPAEIMDLTSYESVRDDFVAKMIELKRPRRVQVGDRLCFIFENRQTVIFQIQEMTRAERSIKEEAIAEEVAVYNDLVPGENELSATLMVEIPDLSKVRAELDRLVGIDEHVFLDVGDQSIRATFDEKQFEEDRISAVQYIKFPLGEEHAAAFCDLRVPVALRVDHPHYTAATSLAPETRASLATDLCDSS